MRRMEAEEILAEAGGKEAAIVVASLGALMCWRCFTSACDKGVGALRLAWRSGGGPGGNEAVREGEVESRQAHGQGGGVGNDPGARAVAPNKFPSAHDVQPVAECDQREEGRCMRRRRSAGKGSVDAGRILSA